MSVLLYSRLCSRKPCLQNHSSPDWEFTTETVRQRTPRSLRANTTLTRGLPRRHHNRQPSRRLVRLTSPIFLHRQRMSTSILPKTLPDRRLLSIDLHPRSRQFSPLPPPHKSRRLLLNLPPPRHLPHRTSRNAFGMKHTTDLNRRSPSSLMHTRGSCPENSRRMIRAQKDRKWTKIGLNKQTKTRDGRRWNCLYKLV